MHDDEKRKVELSEELSTLRKRVAKLQQAGEALRVQGQIVANMSEGVYIIRASDGVIVYTNPKFEQMFGYGPGELVGKNVSIVNAPTEMTPEETAKKIQKALNEKGSWRGEILNIRKDGTPFWCYASVSVFEHPEHGNVWISMHTDITERKEAEEALRESEERLREFFENMGSGGLVYEVIDNGNDFIIKDFNKAGERIASLKKKDIIGKSVFQVFPGVKEMGLIDVFKNVWKTGRSSRYPITQYKDERIILWAENYVYKLPSGEIIAIVDDITERKKAEEALKTSENKYKTLLENLPQKIFLKDRNSVYVSCNENLARDVKIKPEEITGKTDYDFMPKKLAEKYRADDKRIMESGKIEDIEERYIQEGQEVIIHTVKTPIKDGQGNIIGLLGIFWDITERKKAEEELRTQKLAIEQKNLALGEIIAQVELEKNKIKDGIAINVKEVLLPILERLKSKRDPYKYVDLLKRHLEEISSSFGRKIVEKSVKLTSREIEICNMIRGGLTSKEISDLLNTSCQTVEKHRKNIRSKLGITNKSVNLSSYLHKL